MNIRIVIAYSYMSEVVEFALATLRERSPVGSGRRDQHPGLYRDSHMIFIDGHVVSDVSGWQPGQQINISNPEPYSRKIEVGKMKLSVPAHIYEDTAQIVADRYGNQANIKFTYMPVAFGNVAAFASFSKRQRTGRKLNDKARADWLSRQPALQITQR
jgi:hypothetical protein